MRRVAIITGVSSGIGKELCQLLSSDYYVIGTTRSKVEKDFFFSTRGIDVLNLDLNSRSSIDNFLEEIKDKIKGRSLCLLVNNAGGLYPCSILKRGTKEIEKQLYSSVIGTYYLTSGLIPDFSEKGGKIINIGSISASVSTPFLGAYSASKAAMKALTKSWRMELWSKNIQVTQIDIGNVKTGLREKSLFQLKGLLKEIGYDALINRLEKSAVERQDKSMAAGHAAKNIINVIAKPKLKASYLIGRDAKLLSRLQRILPYSLFEKLIMKKIGLPQMN